MALKKCHECKKDVSNTADKCPHCGAKVVKAEEIFKGLFWCVVLGFIAYKYFNKDEVISTTTTMETAAPVIEKDAIKVTAYQISKDYKNNEARGDSLYKGKILHVTGTVQSISKDFTDNTVIKLNGVNDFASVHAEVLPSEVSTAININKGQKVTVQCEGSGEVVGSAMLDNCLIL